MGRPVYRPVQLMGGPADGRTADAGHAWVWVAVQDGELVVFTAEDPDEAMAALERVRRRSDWSEYVQDEDPARADVYHWARGLEIPTSMDGQNVHTRPSP